MTKATAMVMARTTGALYVMGLLLGLAAYVPLVGFFAPVVFGLAFIHYLLGAVARGRISPGYQPHPDKSLDRGNAGP